MHYSYKLAAVVALVQINMQLKESKEDRRWEGWMSTPPTRAAASVLPAARAACVCRGLIYFPLMGCQTAATNLKNVQKKINIQGCCVGLLPSAESGSFTADGSRL